MKGLSSLIAFFFLVVSPVHAATRLVDHEPFAPTPDEFVSAIVMVPRTHQVLYTFDPDKSHPAASLTKLTGALVMTEHATPWNRLVTLRAGDEVGGGRLRVRVGSQLTMRDLLYCSITASANNTAMALARLSGLSRATFLKRMNQAAIKAGARTSRFVDPSGMDPKNITTARDMARIAETAFARPLIRGPAGSATYQFTVRHPRLDKTIKNTNALLTSDPDVWVIGGKTGYLEEAKWNLAVQMRPIDAEGTSIPKQELMVVVLGAPTKERVFASAKKLAEWAWSTYTF